MDKPLSQERLSEEDFKEIEEIIIDHKIAARFTTVRMMERMVSEVKRLQAIERDYIALQEIMDRARKLAFLQAEEEEKGPRFKMDANGNLTRINE